MYQLECYKTMAVLQVIPWGGLVSSDPMDLGIFCELPPLMTRLPRWVLQTLDPNHWHISPPRWALLGFQPKFPLLGFICLSCDVNMVLF